MEDRLALNINIALNMAEVDPKTGKAANTWWYVLYQHLVELQELRKSSSNDKKIR